MKLSETTKLFYGKYLYKLTVRSALAFAFREKNLSYARQVLDSLQHLYEKGEPLTVQLWGREKTIVEEYFLEAKRLYKHFSRYEDYKLRVESIFLSIYTNDDKWLETVKKDISPLLLVEYSAPDPNFKDIEPNTILVNESNGYNYKVTLGQNSGSPEFARWAEANPKLIKLGPVTKEELLNSGYVNGMYFYARDDRTLQLCNLMLSNIRRIDKLVVKQDIDK